MRSIKPFAKAAAPLLRVSSTIYFARGPIRGVEGVGVYDARKRIGNGARQGKPGRRDVVVPVPDSGVPAAIG